MLRNQQSNVLVHADRSPCIAAFGLSTVLVNQFLLRLVRLTVMAPELFYIDGWHTTTYREEPAEIDEKHPTPPQNYRGHAFIPG